MSHAWDDSIKEIEAVAEGRRLEEQAKRILAEQTEAAANEYLGKTLRSPLRLPLGPTDIYEAFLAGIAWERKEAE